MTVIKSSKCWKLTGGMLTSFPHHDTNEWILLRARFSTSLANINPLAQLLRRTCYPPIHFSPFQQKRFSFYHKLRMIPKMLEFGKNQKLYNRAKWRLCSYSWCQILGTQWQLPKPFNLSRPTWNVDQKTDFISSENSTALVFSPWDDSRYRTFSIFYSVFYSLILSLYL